MPATYDLPAVQAAIKARGVACFTRSALVGIREMGLTTTEALAVLAALNVEHFYKTMPAINNPGLFRMCTGHPHQRGVPTSSSCTTPPTLASAFRSRNFDMTHDNTHCMECGQSDSLKTFRGESFTVTHRNEAKVVENLAGQRCSTCGEVFFDEASAAAYATAGDALVAEARQSVAAHLRRVRIKLGLTQRAAAELTGGGHNAFSRYENGQAAPVAAVVNLFTLLDRHPELVHELRVLQRQDTHS